MSSTDTEGAAASDAGATAWSLPESDRTALLALARASIAHGLRRDAPLPVVLDDQPPALRAGRAAFVTLHSGGRLRGCIGHLEALAPLAVGVAENAYAAAFRDPRFPPLSAPELERVNIQISVLTPAEPIVFDCEQGLLDALIPGVDGVILALGARRGTFLPAVWDQLPERREFLRHLKQKAGLHPDYWCDELRAWRYRSECFSEPR